MSTINFLGVNGFGYQAMPLLLLSYGIVALWTQTFNGLMVGSFWDIYNKKALFSEKDFCPLIDFLGCLPTLFLSSGYVKPITIISLIFFIQHYSYLTILD
mgnify:CR=1